MTASARHARIVRVAIKKDDRNVFVATSPNLKGLLVVSKDLVLLRDKLVPDAITELYAACDTPVVLAKLDVDEDGVTDAFPWVAFPMDVAQHAINNRR